MRVLCWILTVDTSCTKCPPEKHTFFTATKLEQKNILEKHVFMPLLWAAGRSYLRRFVPMTFRTQRGFVPCYLVVSYSNSGRFLHKGWWFRTLGWSFRTQVYLSFPLPGLVSLYPNFISNQNIHFPYLLVEKSRLNNTTFIRRTWNTCILYMYNRTIFTELT